MGGPGCCSRGFHLAKVLPPGEQPPPSTSPGLVLRGSASPGSPSSPHLCPCGRPGDPAKPLHGACGAGLPAPASSWLISRADIVPRRARRNPVCGTSIPCSVSLPSLPGPQAPQRRLNGFAPAGANTNRGSHRGAAPVGPPLQARQGSGSAGGGAQGRGSLLPSYSRSLPAPFTRAAHVLQSFLPVLQPEEVFGSRAVSALYILLRVSLGVCIVFIGSYTQG